jgi:U3 small nucleolar ribonucleoprotein protein LCP5
MMQAVEKRCQVAKISMSLMKRMKFIDPPRLAPMPYVEKSKRQSRRDRPVVPSALATLSADPHRPYEEATSGLGGTPSFASARAKHLQRIQDYEEENFTRLVMKKSEAKRRTRDEEDLALGGDLGGGSGRRSRAGGLEDEFGDILRSVSRTNGVRSQGDGYDELRKRGKKLAVLDRSRQKRDNAQVDVDEETPRLKKRSRFELEMKSVKRKLRQRQ